MMLSADKDRVNADCCTSALTRWFFASEISARALFLLRFGFAFGLDRLDRLDRLARLGRLARLARLT